MMNPAAAPFKCLPAQSVIEGKTIAINAAALIKCEGTVQMRATAKFLSSANANVAGRHTRGQMQ